MIILDTNVISELMRVELHENVFAWLNNQVRKQVFVTSISLFEIRYGIENLNPSKRREALTHAFDQFMREGIETRVLSFDGRAAEQAATLTVQRKAQGRVTGERDTFIAAITLCNDATLATRNVRDFDDLQLKLVNPWSYAP